MLQQRYLLVDVKEDWSLQRVIEKESYKGKEGGELWGLEKKNQSFLNSLNITVE